MQTRKWHLLTPITKCRHRTQWCRRRCQLLEENPARYTGAILHAAGTYFMLRNSASGPEIGLQGRIPAGLQATRRADFEALPT